MKMSPRDRLFTKISSVIKGFPQFGILLVLAIMLIIFSSMSNRFLNTENLINVLRQTSTSVIVALGMTFILILGGIDLSVGSIACLMGMLAAGLMTGYTKGITLPVEWAVALVIVLGIGLGAINGLIITLLKLPPFIVTLASMSTVRGIAYVYTAGVPIANIPPKAVAIGRGYVGIIPIPVIVMIFLVLIAWILLSSTKFGRHVQAIGGNEECAKLSGIGIKKTKIFVYMMGGFCATITGVILTLRLGSGQPTMATGTELDAITAAVLGGTSISGGKGSILGTVVGCLFLTFMTNGFNLIGISSYWQQIFKGIILIIAISLYSSKKKQ
jgi:ribose transport system permease protein